MTSDRRPVVRGSEAAWQRLGSLLQLRRAELGYRRRPAFTRERGINIRLVTDIENAYRPNTFLTPTLRDIAQAYAVTYDSLIAVLAGKQDELTPAVPAAPPVPLPPPSPFDAGRTDADRPFFDPINERRVELATRGIAYPTGAQMFGEGTDDAREWDGTFAPLPVGDRVWAVADLRRRAAARKADPQADSAGA